MKFCKIGSVFRENKCFFYRLEMEICDLPEIVFLQILAYLPFKERLLIRRVNKKFKEMSSILISKTKTLGGWTEDEIMNKITPDSFSKLLDLCADNLQSIEFPRVVVDRSVSELVNRFAKFSFPQLISLDLGEASVDDQMFSDLIRNNVNLKSLTWNSKDVSPTFPEDVVGEKLEILKSLFNRSIFAFLDRPVSEFETLGN